MTKIIQIEKINENNIKVLNHLIEIAVVMAVVLGVKEISTLLTFVAVAGPLHRGPKSVPLHWFISMAWRMMYGILLVTDLVIPSSPSCRSSQSRKVITRLGWFGTTNSMYR